MIRSTSTHWNRWRSSGIGSCRVGCSGRLAIDSACTVYPFFVSSVYTVSARAVDLVNARAAVLNDVRRIRDASLDYYAAVRHGYQQRRDVLIRDGGEQSDAQEDELYRI